MKTRMALLAAACAAFSGCASGPSPEYLAAKDACGREMMQRVPRYEPLDVRGAYIEGCMRDHGFKG
jgi:hypothetical protein